MKLARWFGLFLLFAPLFVSAQTIELACPAGSTPLPPVSPTFNNATGGIKRWACVDVFGNVSIQGVFSANGVYFPNTSILAPRGTMNTSGCPAGQPVVAYTQLADSTWQAQASVDESSSGPPTAPAGTLNWCWRTWWNDSGVAMPGGKNRFVSIYHVPGLGGVDSAAGTLDESALSVQMSNTGAEQTFRQLLTNYSELVITGNPTFNGHAAGEISASAYRANLTFSGGTGTNGNRFYTYSAQMEHNDSSTYAGGMGTYQSYISSLNGSGNQAPSPWVGYNCESSNNGGTETNTIYSCLYARVPTARFTTNYGIRIDDYGSNAADFNITSQATASEQGKVRLQGKTLLNHIQTTGPNGTVASPTCAATGTGGGACAVDTGSNDAFGSFTATAAAGAAATGTFTLTYNATWGTNGTTCVMLLSNGTGTWNARATLIGGTMNTGSAVVNWDNNAAALTNGSTYKVNYHCASK